jgi:hypothetical protein
MLEPWELILHHSYSGTPGVAFDHSPGHASHGRGVDLDPSDFVLDGQSAGSGAVRSRRRGRISVTPTANWGQLSALSAELVFRREKADGSGHLVNGFGSFFIALFSDGQLELSVTTKWHTPGSSLGLLRFGVSLADFGIDHMSWVRAGFVYDGVTTVQLFLNGELAKTWTDRPLTPLRPVDTLTIGNERGGTLPFDGLIDDVKIWRPNPNRITRDFLIRILDGGVSDCWRDWGRKFRHALTDLAVHDVECADSLFRQVNKAQAAIAASVAHSAATRQAWEYSLAEYQRLWALGDVAAIGLVLTRLLDTLSAEGVPLDQVAAIRELIESRCFRELLDRVPPLDCDPQFVQMLAGEGN